MIKLTLYILFLLTCFHLSGQGLNEKYLEVTGTSEREITADNVEITIVLYANENVRKENEMQEKEKQIVATVKQFNIPDSAISIDKIAGHRFGYYKTNSNKYQISKVYKIQVRTTTILDDLIIRLFETGANNVFISKMSSSSEADAKTDAAKEALKIARKRAAELAKSMGIEIGDPIQIKELMPGPIEFGTPYLADRYFYMAQGLSDHQQTVSENLNIRKIVLNYTVLVRFAIK